MADTQPVNHANMPASDVEGAAGQQAGRNPGVYDITGSFQDGLEHNDRADVIDHDGSPGTQIGFLGGRSDAAGEATEAT